jgi:rare lipoprotein A
VVLVAAAVLFALYGPYYETGVASWYGPGFDGNYTANGEIYDMNGISAAHKTLPFGTIVRVVDLETGRSVVVRINDRGPFVEGRIIDLSKGAAERLGLIARGITRVGLRIVRWPSDP